MTTIETYINAQVDTLKNCVGCLEEAQEKNNIDIFIIQLRALKKHIDSFMDFMERKRKYANDPA